MTGMITGIASRLILSCVNCLVALAPWNISKLRHFRNYFVPQRDMYQGTTSLVPSSLQAAFKHTKKHLGFSPIRLLNVWLR